MKRRSFLTSIATGIAALTTARATRDIQEIAAEPEPEGGDPYRSPGQQAEPPPAKPSSEPGVLLTFRNTGKFPAAVEGSIYICQATDSIYLRTRSNWVKMGTPPPPAGTGAPFHPRG